MKKDIHPETKQTTVECACGATYEVESTKENLEVEICANCHPFYTGKEKIVDKMGRVEKFKQKMKKAEEQKKKKKEKEEKKNKKEEKEENDKEDDDEKQEN
ncbi:MAG: 50S ribosomal protein L31 [Patescibacteria group bacterium]